MNIKKIFLLISLLVIATFSIFTEPQRNGDGHEYSLITKAFFNHQSPNVTSVDINNRLVDVVTHPSTGYYINIFEEMEKDVLLNKSKTESHVALFLGNNGLYYGYHYWFYPLIVTPVEFFLSIFNLNVLAAFQLTNGLLLFLGIFIITRYENTYPIIKSLVFLFGGVIFYWKWTHPEVLIYTCLFLFSYFLMKKHYKKSIVFLSIASTQVISLTLLYPFILLFIYITDRASFKEKTIYLLKDFKIWFLGLMSISSLLFFYYYFNKITLIGSDYSSISNINFLHFISYWFDWDQGVWVGAPWIILVFLFLNYKNKILNIYLLLTIIMGIVICIPLLSNNNVNAGQSIFQRYALYSIAPIISYVCVYFQEIFNNKVKVFLFLLISIFFTIYYSGPFAKEDNFKHKIWTSYILNYYPELYNPYPDIYIQRTSDLKKLNKSILFEADLNSNNISKVVYSSTLNINEVLTKLEKNCFGVLSGVDGASLNQESLIFYKSFKWTYINTPLKCQGIIMVEPKNVFKSSQNHIEFNRDSFPDFTKSIKNFSHSEIWGTWINGKDAHIIIDNKFSNKVKLKLTMQGFNSLQNKYVIIKVNGIKKRIFINDLNIKEYELDFSFPLKPTSLTIEFLQPDAKSPKEMNLSDDERILGLGLVNIEWINF